MSRRSALALLLICTTVASAQISVEEAQRRLHSKLSTRPASTQPVSETDRLRAENRTLREQNVELQTEVTQLRAALAKAVGASEGASTTRAVASDSAGSAVLRAKLLDRWQGGDLAAGTAFVTQFNDDGTYRQSWLAAPHIENGHWLFVSDDVIEMWTGAAPTHANQWRLTADDATLTLTPVAADGAESGRGKPMVLHHAP